MLSESFAANVEWLDLGLTVPLLQELHRLPAEQRIDHVMDALEDYVDAIIASYDVEVRHGRLRKKRGHAEGRRAVAVGHVLDEAFHHWGGALVKRKRKLSVCEEEMQANVKRYRRHQKKQQPLAAKAKSRGA